MLDHHESSPGKRRWFCGRCGSQLISTRDDNEDSLLLRAGCIDSVGGDTLAGISRVIDLWGNIAVCGMAGGIGLNATNLPLILRGVSLIGISSVNTPYDIRKILWDRLASEWRPTHLESIVNNEVSLDQLGDAFEVLMKGKALGRTVVKLL